MDGRSEEGDDRTLLVLAVHPTSVAATRLRATQYAPHLRADGTRMVLWTFLREEDLLSWYGRSNWRRVLVVVRAMRRLPAAVRAVRAADVVLVQREALPFGPPVLEWYASRRVPLVWDVDDFVWQQPHVPTAGKVPAWVRATSDKFRRMCRLATEVWAGSEVLAAWCRQCSSRVAVIPSVVEVPERRTAASQRRAVGWIGSHSTAPFLEQVLPALGQVSPAPVVVVGADVEAPDGVRIDQMRWSPENELEALGRMRVGLYPIDRSHPMADGKCGLKAVLYMAHGVPPVVTPTPTNAVIVRDGVEGLHAATGEEWASSVASLLADDVLWERLSRAAHERARAYYSLQAWAPEVARRVRSLAGGG